VQFVFNPRAQTDANSFFFVRAQLAQKEFEQTMEAARHPDKKTKQVAIYMSMYL